MNDAICGGLGRLLRTFFLLTPIGLALLLTCLPTSVSARSGGESKNPALVRCAAAIAGDRQVRASLDEEETARCIDLLVDELDQ